MNPQNRKQLDFIVLGAQKCATTWLFDCLSDHPEIYTPAHKRETRYLGGDLHETNGDDWFYSHFAGVKDDQICGDVSVDYLFDPRAPSAVAEHAPDAKLIVSLRNPIERAVSAHRWNVRTANLPDVPVGEALRDARQSLYGSTPTWPHTILQQLLTRGLYGEQLKRYTALFGDDSVLYVSYEELKANPSATLRRLYRYLGVEEGHDSRFLDARPKISAKSSTLDKLQRWTPRTRLTGKAFDLLNQFFVKVSRTQRPSKLDADLYEALIDYYRASVIEVDALISRAPAVLHPTAAPLVRTWGFQNGL